MKLPESTSSGIAWYCEGKWSHQLCAAPGQVVLSGSFNPLHEGHIALKQLAERHFDREAVYELSLTNVDKSRIDNQIVHRRIQQFEGPRVAVTAAATFHEKSQLFPEAVFVIGFDTAERLLQARYYNDDRDKMRDQLRFMKRLGVQFLVAGRKSKDGRFCVMKPHDVADEFRPLFRFLDESEFRRDVSSTELRERSLGQP